MVDVVIAGAGPAGMLLAKRLEGLKVVLVERKAGVGGKPCSALVSKRFIELAKAREWVEGSYSSLQGDGFWLKTRIYLLDRDGWERELADELDIRFGEEVQGFRKKGKMIEVKTSKGILKTRWLVGADGAGSRIGKQLGARPKELLNGLIAEVEGRYEGIRIWLRPDGFMWKIGRKEKIEYGGMIRGGFGVLKSFFDLKHFRAKSAPIPIGPPGKTAFGQVLLLGDAAAQVKPWSGGGLFYSLLASRHAARAIFEDSPEIYEDGWRGELESYIRLGMLFRQFLPRVKLSGSLRIDLDFLQPPISARNE